MLKNKNLNFISSFVYKVRPETMLLYDVQPFPTWPNEVKICLFTNANCIDLTISCICINA